MTEHYAGWLMLLAVFVPAAAVLLGALTLLTPRRGNRDERVARRRARAHA